MTQGGEAGPQRAPWGAWDYFDLGVISVTHGLSDGFNNMLVPVLALIVVDLKLSPVEAGALLSAFSLAVLLFQYPLSLLADASGLKKTVLIAGMGLSALAFVLMGWTGSFASLLALAFIAGAGNTVYHPCGTALAAERFPLNRAFAISYQSLGGNVGTGIMPVGLAALAAAAGWREALAAFALPALVLLPLVGMRFADRPRAGRPAAGPPGRGEGSWELTRRVLRNRNVLLLALTYTLRSMGTKGMIGFLPLLGAQLAGMSTPAIGLAISLHFGMGALTKPVMGWLYDRWGARSALVVPLALTGAFALAMPFSPWEAALIALAGLSGLVSFVSPIILTATADHCDEDVLASSVGVIYACDGLAFISPLIGGWLAGRFGLGSSYVFFALTIWMGVAVSTLLPRGRRVIG
ncbi:MAG: MFS transporter [Nitrospinota bacterium]